MSTTFLPEYQSLRLAAGYAALYRLFAEQDFRYVFDPKNKAIAYFPDASSALKAAKDVVKRKLNPDLPSSKCEPNPEEDTDLLLIEKWRAEKQEEYAKARAYVKNGKRHRQVVVEIKQKKRVSK